MDYKKLYEEQLKENEKLKAQCECDDDGYAISDWFNEKMKKHIECHLSGDGEWGSLGFKNLQVFVDAYDELKEQADKIEEIVRNTSPDDIFDRCLRVWYGDESEDESDEE